MPINVGILGFAHGHVNSYCQQWRERPELGIAVTAGWDHDAARLKSAADAYGLTAYDSPAALVMRSDVDAVVIASDTSRHADLVEIAAAARKAIVLQKPMALTMPEADRIVVAVERYNAPFTLAWQMRVDPQNVKIKELVDSGSLGRLFMVRRRHSLSTHLWAGFADTWHAQPELNRDIFADDAAHAIDFLLWLLGKPETVTAELATMCDSRVPNDNGIAIYRYANGLMAEVVGSFVSPSGENTVEITAERGNIIQNYGDATTCSTPRPADAPGLKWYDASTGTWTPIDIPTPTNQGERIAGLSKPIAEFLHGRRPAIATADEGRTALRMTLACVMYRRAKHVVLAWMTRLLMPCETMATGHLEQVENAY